MTTLTAGEGAAPKVAPTTAEPTVALKRRTIDTVLIASGAVLTVCLFVAGALLLWGSNFAKDYVDDELSSQNIAFPPAAVLQEEAATTTHDTENWTTDLVQYAEEPVNTGPEAEAYASYIDGHLSDVADGATYADLGTPEREAKAAVDSAKAEGADAATIASLQAKSDAITAQRNTLFKGETLRGLLLSAFAWSTVGRIAGIAAIAAFVAGAAMLVLVLFGIRHHHKVVVQAS